MAQRRHHYERAFEAFLRERRIPYIAIDEAKKTLLPEKAKLAMHGGHRSGGKSLKSFDFVLYSDEGNLLVDVKGRRIAPRSNRVLVPGRLESWVTQEDVDSLRIWEQLFGEGFSAAFVFLYLCDAQPPDALFQEVFECRERWYAVRSISLEDYASHLRVRSARWRTVHLATADFERLSRPLCGEKIGA